jgi:hypothetical protein
MSRSDTAKGLNMSGIIIQLQDKKASNFHSGSKLCGVAEMEHSQTIKRVSPVKPLLPLSPVIEIIGAAAVA